MAVSLSSDSIQIPPRAEAAGRSREQSPFARDGHLCGSASTDDSGHSQHRLYKKEEKLQKPGVQARQRVPCVCARPHTIHPPPAPVSSCLTLHCCMRLLSCPPAPSPPCSCHPAPSLHDAAPVHSQGQLGLRRAERQSHRPSGAVLGYSSPLPCPQLSLIS